MCWRVFVWVCVCMGFVMFGYMYVWVFLQLCGCFGNMCNCIYCVLHCLYYVLYVAFMYIYSYLLLL